MPGHLDGVSNTCNCRYCKARKTKKFDLFLDRFEGGSFGR